KDETLSIEEFHHFCMIEAECIEHKIRGYGENCPFSSSLIGGSILLENIPLIYDAIEALLESNNNTSETKNSIGRPLFSEGIKNDYYMALKSRFHPTAEFKKFIEGDEFESKIDFLGNQQELASIFLTGKNNEEISFTTSQKQTADYLVLHFTYNGKPLNDFKNYLSGDKRISEKNLFDLSI
ncbi:hypothetical protein J1N10_21000, partial [Carboxylicivirga sp. A043]|uniref:hypothetical protein n=1 Tax=Carboxylicivirga litoralis TaxID=2816963 RepID=UPI0021CAEF14